MAQPSYLTARLLPLGQNKAADAGLAARLRQVPGVVEAVTIAEENGAYLKVDTNRPRRGGGFGRKIVSSGAMSKHRRPYSLKSKG